MIRSRRSPRNSSKRSSRQLLSSCSGEILAEAPFKLELLKEIYRADRRRRGREFGLVRLRFRSATSQEFANSDVFLLCCQRLRITDSVGWYEARVAFLLPETDKDGTLVFANDITRLCIDAGFDVDTDVSMYPLDDDLIAMADEIQNGEIDEDGDEYRHGEQNGNSVRQSNGQHDADINSARIDFAHDQHMANGLGGHADHATGGVVVAVETSVQASEVVRPYGGAGGQVRQVSHRFVPTLETPWWKRGIDVVGAGMGVLLLSPVFLSAAIAIKLSSKGPIFFRQVREGKDGEQFGILKFRTMVVDAEELQAALRERSEQDGPAFKLTDDPRVTSVGRYLRKSCVDELPQLINVLVGDMSLVGPRPLPVDESRACAAWQRARLTVLPGLTCTWQARGGRDVKFAEWMRMDLQYIEQRSFWFDMKLIVETACLAVMHRGSV